jgi:hypothetical protein
VAAVQASALPPATLLHQCQAACAYADCYVTEVAGTVSQSAFVEAFYTSALIKVERAILARLAGKSSTDLDAKRLGDGTASSFAAWRVESRSADQLLLTDFTGRTKSWLMVAPAKDAAANLSTLLYFGSAVVPKARSPSGRQSMGLAFYSLLWFHRLYSRALLSAARSRIRATR